jgi:hypothetical protein
MSMPTSPGCGPYTSGPGTPYEHATMHALGGQPNMQMMQQQYFSPNMNMPMSAGMDGMGMNFDEENQQQHYFQHAHAMNNMVPDRSMSQPDLRIETGNRPYTPEEQIHSGKSIP